MSKSFFVNGRSFKTGLLFANRCDEKSFDLTFWNYDSTKKGKYVVINQFNIVQIYFRNLNLCQPMICSYLFFRTHPKILSYAEVIRVRCYRSFLEYHLLQSWKIHILLLKASKLHWPEKFLHFGLILQLVGKLKRYTYLDINDNGHIVLDSNFVCFAG